MKVKLLIFLALLISIGYFICGRPVSQPQPQQQQQIAEKSVDNLRREERLSLKKNVVVLGVDERAEEDDAGRSDTLFVVMFDTEKQSVALLSIPRDTRVHIEGRGWDKINHAYAFGGHELTQKTTEQFLGIRIDNYVQVDFAGFRGLVDAIGGIDLDVEKAMYYYDKGDGFTINLEAGMQHLDGAKAIQYVRYRDEDGDIGRIKRQQHFLLAVYQKIASAQMLMRVPGLSKQLLSMIKTDLPFNDMLSIAKAMHQMAQNKELVMATVPGTPDDIGGISYWLPDVVAMRSQMAEMQGAEMSGQYQRAAQLMAAQYQREIAEAKDQVKIRADYQEKQLKGKKAKLSEREKEELKAAKTAAKQAKREQAETAKREQAAYKQEKKAQLAAVRDELQAAKNTAKTQSQTVQITTQPQKSTSTVVRLVNCSGRPEAAIEAAKRLSASGFTVIGGGNGATLKTTTVIAASNNSTILNKINKIPFKHKVRFDRNSAAACDAVIMLGQDYR